MCCNLNIGSEFTKTDYRSGKQGSNLTIHVIKNNVDVVIKS